MASDTTRKDSGFTIVEVLVTLAILSILGTVVTSALVFVNNYHSEKLVSNRSRAETLVVANHLEKTFLNAKLLDPFEPSGVVESLVFTERIYDTIIYRVADGSLYKNGNRISLANVSVDSINVARFDRLANDQDRALILTIFATAGDRSYETSRLIRIGK